VAANHAVKLCRQRFRQLVSSGRSENGDTFKAGRPEVDCIVRKQAALRRHDGDREIGDNTIAIGLSRIAIEAGRLIDRKDGTR